MMNNQNYEVSQYDNNSNFEEVKYDPFQIPPNLKLAKYHQIAKKVGKIDVQKDYNARQMCPCCNLPYEKTEIPFCTSVDELKFLGQGFPLYFTSIIYYILFILLIFVVVSIYNVITTNQYCYQNEETISQNKQYRESCYQFVGLMYTTSKSNSQLTIQSVLVLVSIILASFGLFFIRVLQKKLAQEIDENDITAGDYTILIRRITQFTNEQDKFEQTIRDYLVQNFSTVKTKDYDGNLIIQNRPPEISRMIFARDIGKYVQWCQQKTQLLSESRKVFARMTTVDELRKQSGYLDQIMKEIRELDQKIQIFIHQSAQKNNLVSYIKDIFEQDKCQYVFVTFRYQDDAKLIIDQLQEGFWKSILPECIVKNPLSEKLKINGKRVYIQRAPEPLDIKWENLSFPHYKKVIRRVFTISLSLILMTSGAIIIYLISYLQNKAYKDQNIKSNFIKYTVSILCAFLIQVINVLLNKLVYWASQFEKHSTYTSEMRSTTLILIILQFINTALIPFALFIFTRSDFDSNSLMGSLFFIFISNLFVVPALVIFDPFYCLQLRTRQIIVNQDFKAEYTQMDAHKHFQGPDFDIPEKFTFVNKSILIATFYSCIFPYGTFLEVLALVFYYYTTKWVLLRRCCWPINLSNHLQSAVQNLMNIIPLTLAFGGFCYEYVLIGTEVNLSLHVINLILGFIAWLILPHINMNPISAQVYDRQSNPNPTFEDERLLMAVDYDRCNPITRTAALEEWKQLWQAQEKNNNSIKQETLIQSIYQFAFVGYNRMKNNQHFQQKQAPQDQQFQIIENNVNQYDYTPGNPVAEFHRNNFICASHFMQKQIQKKIK